MRNIILLEFMSLDGVIQAPGGPQEDTSGDFKYGGWTVPYSDAASGDLMNAQMAKPFDLLLGKKTYEIFAAYWPYQTNDNPVTEPFNKAHKYVVSDESFEPTWVNTTVLTGDIIDQLQQLKSQDGPDLQVYGSAHFIQTLFSNDLVDQMWLKIFPVVLGNGKKLFAQGVIPVAFTLTESHVTPLGVIFANYKRAGEVQTGSFI